MRRATKYIDVDVCRQRRPSCCLCSGNENASKWNWFLSTVVQECGLDPENITFVMNKPSEWIVVMQELNYHYIFCTFHDMQAVGPLPQNSIQGRDWDQCWGAAVAETDSRTPSSDHLVEMKENSVHWLETAGQSCTSADDCPCMGSAQLGTGSATGASTFIFPRQKLYIGTPWSFHGIQKFL